MKGKSSLQNLFCMEKITVTSILVEQILSISITRANDFLKFEVIKWAKEKGFKNYVLGGGYGTDDGIFQY